MGHRGIARYHYGTWTNRAEPTLADTSQRAKKVSTCSAIRSTGSSNWATRWCPSLRHSCDCSRFPRRTPSPGSSGRCECCYADWAPAASSSRRISDGGSVYEYPGSVLVCAGSRLTSA